MSNAKILGIDLGYSFVKTSEQYKIESRMSKTEPILGYDRSLVYQGEKYYVGQGSRTLEPNKIEQEMTKVLLLYALFSSTVAERVKVVTGLPIGQFADFKEDLRDMVMGIKTAKCDFNGIPRTVTIEDCAVRPQGVLGANCLTVDIGGFTVDISWVMNGELMYKKTLYNGMFMLNSQIMDAINSKLCQSLPDSYAENVLKGKLEVLGEEQDIEFIEPIKDAFVEPIIEELRKSGSVEKAQICGGGAEALYDAIDARWPSIIAVEPQFANAHMFKKYGDKKWPE